VASPTASGLVATTETPGRGTPSSSVTVPVSLPLPSWANVNPLIISRAARKEKKNLDFFIKFLQISFFCLRPVNFMKLDSDQW